jgi:predicted transcriptional regulator
MNTIELKTNIFELVEKLDDIATLQAIRILLQKQLKISTTVDFWDELPENIKSEIELSIQEANEGKLTSHKDVMLNIKRKYSIQ